MTQKLIDALTDPWVLFGFGAQFLFFLRFFVQWIASERRGKSYVPVIFWWLSLGGGSTLFVYALKRQDPVFIAGQGLGCLIYVRNLVLIYRRQARLRKRKRPAMELLMSDGLSEHPESVIDVAQPGPNEADSQSSDGLEDPTQPRKGISGAAG